MMLVTSQVVEDGHENGHAVPVVFGGLGVAVDHEVADQIIKDAAGDDWELLEEVGVGVFLAQAAAIDLGWLRHRS